MAKQQTGVIYTLTDPRDSRIRYVGQTKQHPMERLAGHLASASNPVMRVWINALALQGLTPRIDVVATPALADLNAEEQKQIAAHNKAGHRLFNAPHYHRHLTDLYQTAAPAPAALKRDDAVASKVDEYAHRVYGGVAAASAAGKLSRGQAAVRVLCWAPAVALVFLWHTSLAIPPVRWAAKTAFTLWGFWIIGFDHLVQDKVMPHLPLREAADFWQEYLERPAINLGATYVGGALLMALFSYSSVRESAGPRKVPAQTRRSALVDDLTADPVALPAARALDSAIPDQPQS
ncbi:hypothetical protein [Streptomyces silvensis]|uniref:GIY-YIG domain-containing protein n=1 Tax=Streptomyces silvensis TaxID=1765722 RepID=A0A0W7X6S6_9ACTN|nr:hypothetical protein [Streptomyces silvensis]KUF18449.1 hypothetical protein AT728_19070 [Streptomyces silvensis]